MNGYGLMVYDETDKKLKRVSYETISSAFHVIDTRIQEQENLGRHIFKDAQEIASLELLRRVFR